MAGARRRIRKVAVGLVAEERSFVEHAIAALEPKRRAADEMDQTASMVSGGRIKTGGGRPSELLF